MPEPQDPVPLAASPLGLVALLLKLCHCQGSILAFFETRQPGKYVTKDTCPDKIFLAHSKLRNN